MQKQEHKIQDVSNGDIHDYDSILKYFNDQPAVQDKKDVYKSITFVTTGIIEYDGGQTTMLHLGTLLSKKGYDVYYLSYVPQTTEEMEANAEANYHNYQGTCLSMDVLDTHKSDIWFATLWESAYVIKNKPGYKMYFVQDYEPYFYPFGDRYQMAKKSYELGLHMISLGPWCAKMVQDNCSGHSKIDQITFPVDLESYPYQTRDFDAYAGKKTFDLAVYTKWVSPRRAPINIQLVLMNTKKILEERDGVRLNIHYFGSDKDKKFINGENLGKLTKQQMRDLYDKCDFGIAPSMTNFSLVPFEMMSTGLPFIDFKEGTGKYFIPKDCSFSLNFDENALANLFMTVQNDVSYLKDNNTNAQKYLKTIQWSHTLKDFVNIIESI
ncbi:glycosyltransferase [Companilactobacillus halodurans]|uniref:Glycosyltransferase family 4 protein n=1 Tax=Companilactobacillus halodurans TaxID=2584183 RepID=A0A5P1A0F5_9LACO|nr:glycosyltransferase family 1 protein [Companilactobacillus halodurans]MQS76908.1 glycosyltransferase family 4 protein [Companilactobacillus halodurans]MQS98384.1 glycosyltransferase family 4 protein [Companilactobacillus halodurans]